MTKAEELFRVLGAKAETLGRRLTTSEWLAEVGPFLTDLEAAARFPKPKGTRTPTRPPKVILDDVAWLQSLIASPAYQGMDVAREVEKCRVFFASKTKPIVPSRQRILFWLNRAEKPATAFSPERPTAKPPIPEPPNWFLKLSKLYPTCIYVNPECEQYAKRWADIPRDVQVEVARSP